MAGHIVSAIGNNYLLLMSWLFINWSKLAVVTWSGWCLKMFLYKLTCCGWTLLLTYCVVFFVVSIYYLINSVSMCVCHVRTIKFTYLLTYLITYYHLLEAVFITDCFNVDVISLVTHTIYTMTRKTAYKTIISTETKSSKQPAFNLSK